MPLIILRQIKTREPIIADANGGILRSINQRQKQL